MSNLATNLIVNAWRDDDFLSGLSHDQQTALPAHPAGKVQLKLVSGAPKEIRAANTSMFESTHCTTSMFDCCGTSMFNTCSTSMFDCCK